MDSRDFFKRENKEKRTICLITNCFCKDRMDCRRCLIPITEIVGKVSITLAKDGVKNDDVGQSDNETDKS